jgi:hypothetical protein
MQANRRCPGGEGATLGSLNSPRACRPGVAIAGGWPRRDRRGLTVFASGNSPSALEAWERERLVRGSVDEGLADPCRAAHSRLRRSLEQGRRLDGARSATFMRDMEAGWKASRLGGGLARLPRLPFIYLRRRERGVQGLTIEAKSIESARGFYDALSAFHGNAGGHRLPLSGGCPVDLERPDHRRSQRSGTARH